MENVENAVRKCPKCGRRFKVKLVSRELEESKDASFQQTQVRSVQGMSSSGLGGIRYGMTPVQEKVPVTVRISRFKYTYRCGSCGHNWIEEREERSRGSDSLKTGVLS